MLSKRHGVFAAAALALTLSACTAPDEGTPQVWHGSGYDPKPGRAPETHPLGGVRRGVEDVCQNATGYEGQDGRCAERVLQGGVFVWDLLR